jgi:hypothetical protein
MRPTSYLVEYRRGGDGGLVESVKDTPLLAALEARAALADDSFLREGEEGPLILSRG